MRTLTRFAAAGTLLLLTSQMGLSQANRSLSNLTSPTQINQNLLPKTTCRYDLGSCAKKWQNLYLGGKAGINICPNYPLDVYNKNYDLAINAFSPYTGDSVDRVGVLSESIIRDNWGYGLFARGGYYGVYGYGYLGASDFITHGVFGIAEGASCNGGAVIGIHGVGVGASFNYGVVGEAYDFSGCGTLNSFTAAGYFLGDVYAINFISASDRKFKTGITQLKSSTLLEQLMKLKPSGFEFKTAEYPKMGLPSGKQIGLTADEVKQVFPELVKATVAPARYDKDRKLLAKEEKYESVDYIGLIPVLIASIQEQQKTIDAITAQNQAIKAETEASKAENKELKSRLANIEQMLSVSNKQISDPTLADASLEQNTPNPFNRNTVINYFLPQKTSSAVMNITDMNGNRIKTATLTAQGKGQLVLEAGQLPSGAYQYSLMVNGKLIDTKKMVLTK
jgi:hypothetical protein